MNINKTIANRRSLLFDDTETVYLGNPNQQSRVHWEANKGGNSLVLTSDGNNNNSRHELALFTGIVQVTHNNCFLAPDSGWTGVSRSTNPPPPFSKINLSFCGGDPLQGDILQQDFKRMVKSIKLFQAQKIKSGNSLQNIIMSTVEGEDSIKFRHALFKPKKTSEDSMDSEGDDSASETESDKEGSYDIYNWPTTTTEASRALSNIQKTHRVRVLSAYSKTKKKIHPTQYRDKLKGAIIEIQFTISHVVVGLKDIFGADIINIDVLRPPQTLLTPSKRRRPTIDDESPQTNKKGRTNEDEDDDATIPAASTSGSHINE